MSFIKQVAHVCAFTNDLGATETFWTEVLQLPITFRFTRQGKPYGFYFTAGGRTNVEFFEKADARFEETNRINHIAFEVEDMDKAVAHIRSKGVSITDKKFGVDETWQAWTADPNGIKIELFQYTPTSAQFVGGDRAADW
jgi:lactoylglutathione lyase/glyoxylase I family protein